jgi:uncharacterized damage-inducible protein DinB
MALNEALLPEFDTEMLHTRKTLERLPDDKLGWRPHPKSMTMGELATHQAFLVSWSTAILAKDSLDLAPVDGPPAPVPEPCESVAAVLEMFDKHVAAAREAIVKADDAHMTGMWSLLAGGRTMFSWPRITVLRSFVMNHTIHHRAQLGVYLRLNDLPVPSIYGPSADEGLGA